MFQRVITETEFNSAQAAVSLPNILFDNRCFIDDATFITTLRAILGDLIPQNEMLFVWKPKVKRSFEEYGICNLAEAVNASDFSSLQNTIALYEVEQQWDRFASWISDIFETSYPDYTRKKNLTYCYESICGALGYYNEKQKVALVFYEKKDLSVCHAIQPSIFSLIPWYVQPKDLPDWKLAIINAYNKKDEQSYMTAVHNAASHYDFRSGQIRKLLSDFEKQTLKTDMLRVSEEIEELKKRTDELFEAIGTINREIDSKLTIYTGLQARCSNNTSTEMMDFFLDNKCLELLYCDGSEIEFLVKTKLYNFDEDSVEDMLENKYSYLYMKSSLNSARTKALFNAIFIDKTLKIRMVSQYNLDIKSCTARKGQHSDGFTSDPTYYPNPHIYHYNCLGTNTRSVVQMLQDGNYQGAVSQCIYSAGNLNIADPTVVSRFVREVTSMDEERQFIELPDGTVVCPLFAIKWLEDNGIIEE